MVFMGRHTSVELVSRGGRREIWMYLYLWERETETEEVLKLVWRLRQLSAASERFLYFTHKFRLTVSLLPG